MKTGEPFSRVSKEEVDRIREEKYEDLLEEFLDAVFDVDSKLERKEWESQVANK